MLIKSFPLDVDTPSQILYRHPQIQNLGKYTECYSADLEVPKVGNLQAGVLLSP